MSLAVYPVTSDFAAEIGDVDLSRPLSDEHFAEIEAALWRYAVLIFPDQQLVHDQHLDFARLFGPLEGSIVAFRPDTKLRVEEALADVSNLDENNRLRGPEDKMRHYMAGNKLWHTDSSFRYVPARVSLLYARSIPPVGGHTEFADERAAYDALPETTKQRIDGLIAEHEYFNSRAKIGFYDFSEEERAAMPAVPQVLVRRIPESGRKSLYLASHAGRILDLPDEEGRMLIEELTAHATRREFVYTHRWRRHDLVIWDNRCTMHRGRDYDDLRWPRDMVRATVAELANSCELNSARAGVERDER